MNAYPFRLTTVSGTSPFIRNKKLHSRIGLILIYVNTGIKWILAFLRRINLYNMHFSGLDFDSKEIVSISSWVVSIRSVDRT